MRVVQCAVKYANVEQKKSIARELQGTYRELAESRYAKFLVAKLMVEDKEIREMIISEFYGSVRRLINHPEASWILDDTYRQIATPQQKAILLREWYGPEFAITNKDLANKPGSSSSDDITADLPTLLAAFPEKRNPMTTHLFSMINALVQKKLTGFTMLHDAMLQYSLSLSPSDTSSLTTLLDLLKPTEESDTDLLKNLAFTASGARLVRRALAHATAKDRKALLKPYKDLVAELAADPHGHTILLAAYTVVDDTVLTSKFIFPTLAGAHLPAPADRTASFLATANHPTARIALLLPLLPASTVASPKASRWLIPDGSPSAAALDELRDLRATLGTSKKDAALRRQELAKALLAQSDGALLAAVADQAGALCETSFGCQMVQEVLLAAPAALGLEGADGERVRAAMAAVAALAQGDPAVEGHVAQSSAAGRMLKTLVLGARFDPTTKTAVRVEPGLGFADVLFGAVKSHLVDWATGASSFVVANLFEETSGFDAGLRKEATRILGKERKRLEEAGKKGNKGASMVLEALEK